jgi:hypothetical protein
LQAYQRAMKWMEGGEDEAAAAGFGLALKERHPDRWGCYYMRGVCCRPAPSA